MRAPWTNQIFEALFKHFMNLVRQERSLGGLFKIKMEHIDNSYNHGGGTVAYNGSDRIPMGALKKYKGPCPMIKKNLHQKEHLL